MRSLHGRLLVAATLVLAGFLGATGLVLDKAFRESALAAMRDRLQGHIYALLAAADPDAAGHMTLPHSLPDPRFSNTESGLYAQAAGEGGRFHWRSPSLTGSGLRFIEPMVPAQTRFTRFASARGEPLYAINFGVAWEDNAGAETRYTFAVAESMQPVLDQIDSFRVTLRTWLGGFALALLVAQGLILRWGLGPLRKVAGALREIEAGRSDAIHGQYPRELNGLVQNLNSLIQQSRANQKRYRESLGDLAHSMKTPLAILRATVEEATEDPVQVRTVLDDQVSRMDTIIQHQLQRAVTSGRSVAAQAIPVAEVVERIRGSLDKVYREKGVECRLEVESGSVFYGDEADLMEVMGNLMDNAYKYCRRRVAVAAAPLISGGAARPGLWVLIDDDGPGIDAADARVLLRRGMRRDEVVPGQGIGLTVADEIIGLYEGDLQIAASPMQGARISIRFPAGPRHG